jgi:hypothetical protein
MAGPTYQLPPPARHSSPLLVAAGGGDYEATTSHAFQATYLEHAPRTGTLDSQFKECLWNFDAASPFLDNFDSNLEVSNDNLLALCHGLDPLEATVRADHVTVSIVEFSAAIQSNIALPLSLEFTSNDVSDTYIPNTSTSNMSTRSTASPPSGSSPHRRDGKNKIHHCAIPTCHRSFKRRQELSRHHKSKHQRSEEYPCRVVGCGREKGVPRKDNRDDHERKVHGVTRKQ